MILVHHRGQGSYKRYSWDSGGKLNMGWILGFFKIELYSLYEREIVRDRGKESSYYKLLNCICLILLFFICFSAHMKICITILGVKR
jgi:hypothetical protein